MSKNNAMFLLVAHTLFLTSQMSAIPTMWSVTAEGSEYRVQRHAGGHSVIVYREPVDLSDTYGPNGTIRELWPSRTGKAFAFIRWSERTFDESGRSEKRLVTYDIVRKHLATVWADSALPTFERIQATDYFVWMGDEEYRLPVLFMGEVRISFESILPNAESEGTTMLRTGYSSWADYFARVTPKAKRLTLHFPPIPITIDLPNQLDVDIVLNASNELNVTVKGAIVLRLSEGTFVREVQFDGTNWLTVSTYRQVSPGSTAAHPITTLQNYQFASYLIDCRTAKVVFKNGAYLLRSQ